MSFPRRRESCIIKLMAKELKLMSWNVNGIRAAVKNGFGNMLLIERPDIIGLQEIKITKESRDKETFDFPGYKEYWFPASRPGYSGTAILVKSEKRQVSLSSRRRPGSSNLTVKSYKEGLGIEAFDVEGRVQTMEFEDFYFVNTYFPNSGPVLARLKYKQEFNLAWLLYIKKLEKKKPVVTCGDFNVAHQEIDLARPKANTKSAGFTKEERADIAKFLETGLIDTFRLLYPETIKYSWWSYRTFGRDRNVGWRIDYFLASEGLKKNIKKAFILDEVLGSDHCPVGIIVKM